MSRTDGEPSPNSKWFRVVALLLFVAAVSGVIFLWFSHRGDKASEGAINVIPPTTESGAEISQPDPEPPLTFQFQPFDPSVTFFPGAEELGNSLNDPEQDPKADLDTIQDLLRIFRRANQGSNPSGGENEEIMAGILGKNPAKMSFLSYSHPAISGKGELLDRWGTPYWFHPVSRDFMEVRSAGPDKTLFTEDDVIAEAPDGVAEGN